MVRAEDSDLATLLQLHSLLKRVDLIHLDEFGQNGVPSISGGLAEERELPDRRSFFMSKWVDGYPFLLQCPSGLSRLTVGNNPVLILDS